MPERLLKEIVRTRTLHAATPDTTVRDAAKRMAETRIGALVVTDGGRLLGIFTERDALTRVIAAGADPDHTTLAQVMTTEPRTIGTDRPLGHALHLMFDGGYRHMPVTEDGKVVGMVSVRDALGPELVAFENQLAQRDELFERMG